MPSLAVLAIEDVWNGRSDAMVRRDKVFGTVSRTDGTAFSRQEGLFKDVTCKTRRAVNGSPRDGAELLRREEMSRTAEVLKQQAIDTSQKRWSVLNRSAPSQDRSELLLV